nr:hypothetical protein [Tanacetum cinerariifolium]
KQIEADDQAIQTILLGLPEDITDPTTAMNMALAFMAKAFNLNYSTPTNNNQRISSYPRNRQIAQPGMNMGQDRQMQMIGGNGGNQFRQYAGKNSGNLNGYNKVQNVGNQEIWLRVQQMMKGSDIGIQEKKAKLFNEWERFTSNEGESIESYYHPFKLNYSTPTNNNQRISSNPRNRQIAQPVMNMGQDRQRQMIGGNGGNQFRQYAGQNVEN